MHQTKSLDTTPDQLLQMLDMQLAMQRARRTHGSHRRTIVRVFGVFLILCLCLGAFLILQYALSEMAGRELPSTPSAEQFETP